MNNLLSSAPRPVEPALGGMAHGPEDRAEPLLRPGNTNCGGCGMSLAWQFMSRAAAARRLQVVIPACCGIVTAGPFPWSAYGVPVVASTFASAPAVAAGLAAVARQNGEDTRVLCWAGDGGTYDIGLATLSAAAERNDDVLYICYDNEIYGNTGGQRSSATPLGAATTTTPAGKEVRKKDIMAIMAAHRIPYAATLSLAHPDDALRKLRQALDARGFRFLHVLSPCPTGWKSEPAEGVALVRLAVQSGLYPVYEVFDGRRVVINVEPEGEGESPGEPGAASAAGVDALARYFEAQGRFRRSEGVPAAVRADLAETWADLRARAARGAV